MGIKIRPKNKPDFVRLFSAKQGFVRAKNVIPVADRLALIRALPKRMDEVHRASFVDVVLRDAELSISMRYGEDWKTDLEKLPEKDITGQIYLDKLLDVATNARNLLKAIERMNPSVAVYFSAIGVEHGRGGQSPEGLAYKSRFMAELFHPLRRTPPGGDLASIWDVLQDIENVTRIAAGNIRPQIGKRPKESLTAGIVFDAANTHKAMFFKDPPLTKSGWFALWLSDLGGMLGLPFGAGHAAASLKKWQAKQNSQSPHHQSAEKVPPNSCI